MKSFVNRHIPELLLSIFAGVLFGFFAPLELYVSNFEGFSYDIYDMLKLMVPISGAVIAGIFAVLLLLKKLISKIYCFVLAGTVAIFFALYLQGTFFSKDVPVIEGTDIDWSAYSSNRLVSVILFAAVIVVFYAALFILKKEKFRTAIASLCGVASAMLLISSLLLALNSRILTDKLSIATTGSGMLEYSTDKNFIILLTDMVDATALSDLLEIDDDFKNNFDGFTFFRNTVGAYSFTFHSIPYVLTGEFYENDRNFYDYLAEAFDNSPLLTTLRTKGYRLGVYEEEMIPARANSVEFFENVELLPESRFVSNSQFIKMQLLLTGFKYLPYQLKPYCALTPDDIFWDTEFVNSNPYSDNYTYVNESFYEKLMQEPITLTDNDCFRFIHIQGAHSPIMYGKNMLPVENAGYFDGVDAAATLISMYLEKLKEAGVYDNSVIIVMSDHGFNHRQNPALFIKGMNEHHPLAISEAPISYVDLQGAYLRLIDGSFSDSVFDWNEGDNRTRRFIYYTLGDEDHMIEMEQIGYAPDNTTLIPTGVEYFR